MDHFHKLKRQVQSSIFVILTLCTAAVVIAGWFMRRQYPGYDTLISSGLLLIGVALAFFLSIALTNYTLKPLGLVWRAVLHVSPGHASTAPPNLGANGVGHELVTSLAMQVYQLASTMGTNPDSATDKIVALAQAIADNIPIPLYVMDADQTILFANDKGITYLGMSDTEIVGKNAYSVLDMSFPDEDTFDSWLQHCRTSKVTDTHYWNHARLQPLDDKDAKQFEMAAHYSKDNSAGIETIIALFDQTNTYDTSDNGLDFVALAVHELRTPLTVLRGYIEVFEDELSGQLNPEMTDFMHKLNASAQQLTAFVSNILNVARVEENQLTLQLTEGNWNEIVKEAVASLNLRAQVHGKTITYTSTPNLPSIAVDRVSVTEVINNMVDNAIKYSTNSEAQKIIIHTSLTADGMIETTVQDFGVGIPTPELPHLFEKFERNFHTRSKIGGTGLGLYLCKAIVTAHGGNIWVTSTEGKGSTFGFTLQQYSQLAEELKQGDNKEITRSAHGWIKNHSLYRR